MGRERGSRKHCPTRYHLQVNGPFEYAFQPASFEFNISSPSMDLPLILQKPNPTGVDILTGLQTKHIFSSWLQKRIGEPESKKYYCVKNT